MGVSVCVCVCVHFEFYFITTARGVGKSSRRLESSVSFSQAAHFLFLQGRRYRNLVLKKSGEYQPKVSVANVSCFPSAPRTRVSGAARRTSREKESASPQGSVIFYPIKSLKFLLFQHDSAALLKLRRFVVKTAGHRVVRLGQRRIFS